MLKHGAALRFPIYDANGILLLAQGALINDRLRKILEVRGISLEIQASLKVLQGGQIGLEIPVDKPFINFGRRPDCDLQLASRVVSGHHCRIIKAEFAVLLRDLGSCERMGFPRSFRPGYSPPGCRTQVWKPPDLGHPVASRRYCFGLLS